MPHQRAAALPHPNPLTPRVTNIPLAIAFLVYPLGPAHSQAFKAITINKKNIWRLVTPATVLYMKRPQTTKRKNTTKKKQKKKKHPKQREYKQTTQTEVSNPKC